MILAFTGHRKIFDQYYPHKSWDPICAKVVEILKELKPSLILSGAALGFDQLGCDAAISLKIPYLLAVPFVGQEQAWPPKSQERYQKYLKQAAKVVIVSEGGYSPEKMHKRNEYLVDHCNHLLACIIPDQPSGALKCLTYAKSKNKPITIIDPTKLT